MGKTLIIAEAGVNHNGSIDIAKKLIEVAAEAGVDFVKFQTFKADKLVTRSAQKAIYQKANDGSETDTQYEMLKNLELSEENHFHLKEFSERLGIHFFSTAFDEYSQDFLDQLNMTLYKIPSGEITNLPYLRKVAQKKKPTILSTGMATLGEIESAITVLVTNGLHRGDLTILHCNTEYPTPFVDVNLKAMQTLQQAFGVNVGYSDHTMGIEVPIAAVALGATVIEKHFTLDRSMKGPDHAASLEPNELKAMVIAIRNIELAMSGDGQKKPSPSEWKNRDVARKSIHIKHDLSSGHILTSEDMIMKRPGTGISPMESDLILGKKLNQDLVADTLLLYSHLMP
jgi:N-acetylneuraminate synthase/N,N'-diacetyllegionaminate synthase